MTRDKRVNPAFQHEVVNYTFLVKCTPTSYEDDVAFLLRILSEYTCVFLFVVIAQILCSGSEATRWCAVSPGYRRAGPGTRELGADERTGELGADERTGERPAWPGVCGPDHAGPGHRGAARQGTLRQDTSQVGAFFSPNKKYDLKSTYGDDSYRI